MTRTVTGNAILMRLAASTMIDGATNAYGLEALYDAYDYGYPGISRKIYDFIRKCGVTKVSKRTIKLAQLAVDYFDKKERKFEMTDMKDLYIPCPGCNSMMRYDEDAKPILYDKHGNRVENKEFDEQDTVTFVCDECDCSITTLKDHIEKYATALAEAAGIYGNDSDVELTLEEEGVLDEFRNDEHGD